MGNYGVQVIMVDPGRPVGDPAVAFENISDVFRIFAGPEVAFQEELAGFPGPI